MYLLEVIEQIKPVEEGLDIMAPTSNLSPRAFRLAS